MIRYDDKYVEKLNTLNIKTVKKYIPKDKETIEYLNIECGFDIETTSMLANGEKFAFMYEWTFGIKDASYICYGREWKEFLSLINDLKNIYHLCHNKRLVIYVHNLGYEFQFMRKYMKWESVFATDERKPIKAITIDGIEFRDSYILSGYSLAKLADNLVNHHIKKLMGNLDYSLVRTSKTYLSDEELSYCNNDVEIVLDYINEQIAQYKDITKIPMTNTGRVRQFVRAKCLHYSTNHKKESNKGKVKRYRELMAISTLSLDEYTMCKKAFMGGFTHASMNWVNQTLYNVHSIDFTSSYPYVMLSEKFPMGKPKKVDLTNEELESNLDNDEIGYLLEITFYNIHSLNTYETYLSESKCYNVEKPLVNNGRIFQAGKLTTTITDTDFTIIKACYKYDHYEITQAYKFYMQYLPFQILDSILELYEGKTTLKGVKGKEVEYLLKKGMLNSVYGMCVTDIIRSEIEYSDGWKIEPPNADSMEEQIEKYNTSKQRFLYYPWGIWVTAYARHNLWTGILAIGDDYIYSDTDSIKFFNYDKHKAFIDDYNKNCYNKLVKMCDFRKIDINRCKPKTIKGVEKLIGVFDYEGRYDIFKTLGAKRYMYYQDGDLHITVAGLSKQNGVKYLKKKYGSIENIFKNFNDKLYIPANETGKNTHTYIDECMTANITDYTGITTKVTSLSSVHLSECDFTLNISKQYAKFLNDFIKGYIYVGTKYQ